ncbi:endonuclease/exonuclease/phosphatase family protein [Limibacter armeniacum]|uniref:endonuclease/exonuclease/phosphatase family protein n=1 Tax=Limibacter armeniacum TaxID=466084 RepID=UPI002FE6AAFC
MKEKMSFLKGISILFLGCCSLLLLGRDHYLLGTSLIIFRWAIVLIGIIILYRIFKITTLKILRGVLFFVLLLLLVESLWYSFSQPALANVTEGVELEMMTYNVFFRNKNPLAVIRQITKRNPEILVLQEVTPKWKKTLSEQLSRVYPYNAIYIQDGTHGIACFSKYPILSDKLLLNSNQLPFAQVLDISIKDKRLQLFNVHLASPAVAVEHPDKFMELYKANYELRKTQLDEIMRLAKISRNKTDAQVLIGDLNTMSFEPLYRDLNAEWVNLYSEKGEGWGLNFPNLAKVQPFVTLDYIFIRGQLQAVGAEVISGGSSDHLPVTGRVMF